MRSLLSLLLGPQRRQGRAVSQSAPARGPGGRAMSAKLFVGNLSFQATEEDLRELFAQAGTVETVRIITDQFTGRPRGFGFVEMANKEEALKAVEMLNGRLFRDRNLVVDEARPQPQRGGGGPRSDRGGRPGGGRGGRRRQTPARG